MTSRTRTADGGVTTPSPSEPGPRAILALALTLLALAALYAMVSYTGGSSIVYLCDRGERVLVGQLPGGVYPVVFDFTHSVHKTNEKDVLETGAGGFRIAGVALREYGAGTPYTLGDAGAVSAVEVDGYTVYMGGRGVGPRVNQSLDLPVYMNVYIGRVSFETGECRSLQLVYTP